MQRESKELLCSFNFRLLFLSTLLTLQLVAGFTVCTQLESTSTGSFFSVQFTVRSGSHFKQTWCQ